MAIYTELTSTDIAHALTEYGLPAPDRITPIPEGSINTNYRVDVSGAPFFLRHTDVRSAADLRFEAEVVDALRRQGVRAPVMRRAKNGEPSVPLRSGNACLFEWLNGSELVRSGFTVRHAEALGVELGRMHVALKEVRGSRDNPYGPQTVRGWLSDLRASPHDLGAVPDELNAALELAMADTVGALKTGVIHADLFIDNVKWSSPDEPVFFDFEMACRDALVLDVAITLNAWAFDGKAYMVDQARAFITAYQRVRPFAGAERHRLWNQALFGAVRYTCSRIRDFHLSPLSDDKLFKKDYRTYLERTRVLLEQQREGFLQLLGI